MADNTVSQNESPVVGDSEWAFDLQNVKHMKMGDKRRFQAVLSGKDTDADESIAYPVLAKMIVKWPYPLDPHDVASYDELEIEQFNEVMAKVQATFR